MKEQGTKVSRNLNLLCRWRHNR